MENSRNWRELGGTKLGRENGRGRVLARGGVEGGGGRGVVRKGGGEKCGGGELVESEVRE